MALHVMSNCINYERLQKNNTHMDRSMSRIKSHTTVCVFPRKENLENKSLIEAAFDVIGANRKSRSRASIFLIIIPRRSSSRL